MKKRISRPRPPLKNSNKTFEAKTGWHCPANGWWVPIEQEGEGRFIVEGSLMPSEKGQPLTWVLVNGDLNSYKPKHSYPPAGASIDGI